MPSVPTIHIVDICIVCDSMRGRTVYIIYVCTWRHSSKLCVQAAQMVFVIRQPSVLLARLIVSKVRSDAIQGMQYHENTLNKWVSRNAVY